jgi:hypothetical protein
VPNLKYEVSSFPPAVVHCHDAALLKYPITLIDYCIRVLPGDMDRALNRIRDGFTSVVSGDAVGRLAYYLAVGEEQLPRLPQLDGELATILEFQYTFD